MKPIESRIVTKVITPDKAHELIEENGNKFFWTAFIRKTDKKVKDPITGTYRIIAPKGTVRYMNCQTGVKKHRVTPDGSGRKYDFKERRLTNVFDRKSKGYRTFAWDYLLSIRIKGVDYVVLNERVRKFCKANSSHPMTKVIENAGVAV